MYGMGMVWEHGGDQAEDCSGASLLAAKGLKGCRDNELVSKFSPPCWVRCLRV